MDDTPRIVEHPSDFRADARIGGISIVRLSATVGVIVLGLVIVLFMLMKRQSGWHMLATFAAVIVLAAQISFNWYRRLSRWIAYRVRPRELITDMRRAVTLGSDQTVQDLVKIQACTGPFIEFMDGYYAMVLRMQPQPTGTLSQLELTVIRQRFQAVLKRVTAAKVEMAIYTDVEPDLNRPELARLRSLTRRWPASSGVRRIMEVRLNYHEAYAAQLGRRTTFHVRLAILPEHVPVAQQPKNPEEHAAQVVAYLREIGMGIAGELRSAGVKVHFLGPAGIRDVCTKQWDPAGWAMADPPQQTNWAYPIGEERPVLTVPPAPVVEETAAPIWQQPDEWEEEDTEAAPAPVPATEEPFMEPVEVAAPGIAQEEASQSVPVCPIDEPKSIPAAAPVAPLAAPIPEAPEPPARPIRQPAAPVQGRRQADANPQLAPIASREILAVIGADRKTGASTVAASIAMGIRNRGNSVSLVSLEGRNDLVRWLVGDVLVNNHMWQRAAEELWLEGPRGTTLTPGPTRLPGGSIPALPSEAITKVLGITKRESDIVVMDLGSELGSEQRVALMQATGVIIVTTPDLHNWDAAQLRIEMAAAQGLPRDSIVSIVNRNRGDASQLPGRAPLVLPEDNAVQGSWRMGSVPVIGAPDSPWSQAVINWVNQL